MALTRRGAVKIDPTHLRVVLEEELENVTLEQVAQQLPDSFPRYVLYTLPHGHPDGRVSYPLLFIFVSPTDTKPELMMMYSGTKTSLVRQCGATKVRVAPGPPTSLADAADGRPAQVFDVRSVEELSDEWAHEQIAQKGL